MKDAAIRIEALGKRYRIGQGQRYKALRDTLTSGLHAPFRSLASILNGRRSALDSVPSDRYVWALKDVSFAVNHGEVMGIIGPNGAGKSTLLKIISRITEPTEGRAEVRGRIVSLLEVGTGFHPELTGRENIYLNGAIMGMRKAEIDRKFDEIVSFSELEKFIETPVKLYSSGMYVRLAFSVAANMEPEILLVDEVLAVGDAAFQRKCLAKMESMGRSGATVLLVSHNMAAIKALSSKAVWLDNGTVKSIGSSTDIVGQYLLSVTAATGTNGFFHAHYIESQRIRGSTYLNDVLLTEVTLRNSEGHITGSFREGADVLLEMTLQCRTPITALHARVPVSALEGLLLFECFPGSKEVDLEPGRYKVPIKFSLSSLLPGSYQGEVILSTSYTQDRVVPAFQFDIQPTPRANEDPFALFNYPSAGDGATRSDIGLIRVDSSWGSIEAENQEHQ